MIGNADGPRPAPSTAHQDGYAVVWCGMYSQLAPYFEPSRVSSDFIHKNSFDHLAQLLHLSIWQVYIHGLTANSL